MPSPSPMPLAIIRCALLTPLDSPTRSTWDALSAGQRVEQQTAIADALLDPDTTLDRSLRMALAVATRALLPDIETHSSTVKDPPTLFCGTSKGPVLTLLAGLEHLRHGRPIPEPLARQIALGTGALGALLARRLALPGGHTSVAACSSGMHALHRAAQAIRRGECDRALVVAADASLHPLFEASFARLGVLAPADAAGVRRCTPFSAEGRGFFLTEAAAAILLENPARTTAAPLATLTDTLIAADSTHLVAIDPAAASLRQALHTLLGGHPSALRFIHAHATGTDHDRYELAALRALAGPAVPVFSHKAWLGHSLGAAGLVSLVLSLHCHIHHALPGGAVIAPGGDSLTIAQGFGGHIAVAKLHSRPD